MSVLDLVLHPTEAIKKVGELTSSVTSAGTSLKSVWDSLSILPTSGSDPISTLATSAKSLLSMKKLLETTGLMDKIKSTLTSLGTAIKNIVDQDLKIAQAILDWLKGLTNGVTGGKPGDVPTGTKVTGNNDVGTKNPMTSNTGTTVTGSGDPNSGSPSTATTGTTVATGTTTGTGLTTNTGTTTTATPTSTTPTSTSPSNTNSAKSASPSDALKSLGSLASTPSPSLSNASKGATMPTATSPTKATTDPSKTAGGTKTGAGGGGGGSGTGTKLTDGKNAGIASTTAAATTTSAAPTTTSSRTSPTSSMPMMGGMGGGMNQNGQKDRGRNTGWTQDEAVATDDKESTTPVIGAVESPSTLEQAADRTPRAARRRVQPTARPVPPAETSTS